MRSRYTARQNKSSLIPWSFSPSLDAFVQVGTCERLKSCECRTFPDVHHLHAFPIIRHSFSSIVRNPPLSNLYLSQTHAHFAMDSSTNEIAFDYLPYFRVYKDGRVERLGRFGVPDRAPTGLDPKTQVQTKDIVVSSESGVSARLFLPKISNPDHKLPLVVHYHGGGFCTGSPCNRNFHNFLASLASEATAIVISVEYRLAPKHPLPTAHQDSLAALQWIGTHSNGQGPDPWLNEHADFGRVFLAGESAGANIAHYVAVQAGATQLVGPNIVGLLIVQPLFGGKELDKRSSFLYPTSTGFSDPILYPEVDPDLSRMAGAKVLVCVAEKDLLRDRGVAYSEALGKSGWGGAVSFYETEGEDHGFFLVNPSGDKVEPLVKVMADFINQD